jgi:3-deoxy-D-arabino-heptulosonate 7-phosphate (DAHP) synthase class II
MPTLSLPDGSTLTWGEQPELVPDAAPVPEEPGAMTASEPEAPPTEVKAALATMPPKWRATSMRFLKGIVATMAATLVVYGGDFAEIVRDPRAFFVALGSSVVLAVQKWATWKDE